MLFRSKLKDLALWMKQNQNAEIYLTGYADADTGNPKLNMALSKKRAEGVAKALKEKYGIDEKRMHVSYKGDTVQPYPTPEQNRCVVITTKK